MAALERQVLGTMREKYCSKQLGLQFGIPQGCCVALPSPHACYKTQSPRAAGAPGTALPGSREMQTPRATASHLQPTAQPSGHEGIFFLETLLQREKQSPKTIPSAGSHKGLTLCLRLSPSMWMTTVYTQRTDNAGPQRGQDLGAASTASPAHRNDAGVMQYQTLHSYLQVLANASTTPARLRTPPSPAS